MCGGLKQGEAATVNGAGGGTGSSPARGPPLLQAFSSGMWARTWLVEGPGSACKPGCRADRHQGSRHNGDSGGATAGEPHVKRC